MIKIKVKFLKDWKSIKAGQIVKMKPALVRLLESKEIVERVHITGPEERH